MSIIQTSAPSHFTTSAFRGWLFERIERFRKWRQRRRQQRIDRLAFQRMLTLDDHLLNDIGHQRADLEDANNLPLDVNAAQAMRMLRAERLIWQGIRRR
jgi:hypothetical protein